MRHILAIIFFFALWLPCRGQDTIVAEPFPAIQITGTQPIFHPAAELTKAELLRFSGSTLADVLPQLGEIYLKTNGPSTLSTPSFRGGSGVHTNIMFNGLMLNSPANALVDLSLLPLSAISSAKLSMNSEYGRGLSTLTLSSDEADSIPFSLNAAGGSFGNYGLEATSSLGQWHSTAYVRRNLNQYPLPNGMIQQNARADTRGLITTCKLGSRNLVSVWAGQADRYIPSISGRETGERQQDDWLRASLILRADSSSKMGHRLMLGASAEGLRYTLPSIRLNSNLQTLSLQASHQFSPLSRQKSALTLSTFLPFSLGKTQEYGAQWQQLFTPSLTARWGLTLARNLYLLSGLGIQSLNGSRTDPTAEIIFTAHRKQRSYGISAARAVQYPSLNDLYWAEGGNQNLRTEKILKAETFFHQGFKQVFLFRLNPFLTRSIDRIVWYPDQFGLYRANNLQRVLTYGTAFSSAYNSKSQFLSAQIRLAYTRAVYLPQGSYRDLARGNLLLYSPLWTGSATIAYSKHWGELFATAQYAGIRYTTTDNQRSLPPYFIASAGARRLFAIRQHLAAFSLRADNLFDLQYQAVEGRPLTGRSLTLNLNYSISKKSATQQNPNTK